MRQGVFPPLRVRPFLVAAEPPYCPLFTYQLVGALVNTPGFSVPRAVLGPLATFMLDSD